ncbi:MAG: flagellar export chaperone FliS [Lachnospiraceae bacterium]|nr:flagellar export chaperone FliS [Lachnospiraceae bacterium]
MALPQAYAQYNNSRILTAKPAELTLMLYEGAIKFCNIAIQALADKDLDKAHQHIIKVERIIDYLRKTLDMKYEVAQDFENIYVYLYSRLTEANITKDPEILKEVNTHLHSIRDNWKLVMEKVARGEPDEVVS